MNGWLSIGWEGAGVAPVAMTEQNTAMAGDWGAVSTVRAGQDGQTDGADETVSRAGEGWKDRKILGWPDRLE